MLCHSRNSQIANLKFYLIFYSRVFQRSLLCSYWQKFIKYFAVISESILRAFVMGRPRSKRALAHFSNAPLSQSALTATGPSRLPFLCTESFLAPKSSILVIWWVQAGLNILKYGEIWSDFYTNRYKFHFTKLAFLLKFLTEKTLNTYICQTYFRKN